MQKQDIWNTVPRSRAEPYSLALNSENEGDCDRGGSEDDDESSVLSLCLKAIDIPTQIRCGTAALSNRSVAGEDSFFEGNFSCNTTITTVTPCTMENEHHRPAISNELIDGADIDVSPMRPQRKQSGELFHSVISIAATIQVPAPVISIEDSPPSRPRRQASFDSDRRGRIVPRRNGSHRHQRKSNNFCSTTPMKIGLSEADIPPFRPARRGSMKEQQPPETTEGLLSDDSNLQNPARITGPTLRCRST